MTKFYPQDWQSYLSVFQIFVRALGLFVLVPGFSHQALPMRFRLSLALVLSLALFPVLQSRVPVLPYSLLGLVTLVARETAVGLLMGFAAYLTFESISLACQFIGSQMGLGMSGMVDPMNHSQSNQLVAVGSWLTLMIFFATNTHHTVLQLFLKSFDYTSSFYADTFTSQQALTAIITLSGKLFIIAVKMAAPFTLILLLCNIALGVLGRMLPHMNILLFSFPITILLGIGALYLLAPELLDFVEHTVTDMVGDMAVLMRFV